MVFIYLYVCMYACMWVYMDTLCTQVSIRMCTRTDDTRIDGCTWIYCHSFI